MTTITELNEPIVRKIQKLLSLANNPNEHEASLAMAKAQSLLAEYNLDLAVVRDTAVAGGTVAPVEEKREKTRINRSAQYTWQRELWGTLARANFCFHFVLDEFTGEYAKRTYKPIYKKRHSILGRQSNVIAVQLMGEYLCDTIERLLPYPNVERLSRSAVSWRSGCADRLMERIREQHEADTKPASAESGSTALVLADVHKSEYIKNYDAQYGEGAWARKQERKAQWDKEYAEELAESSKREAEEQEERMRKLAAETPEQREKRETRERKAAEKEQLKQDARNRRWHRQSRAERSKVDWSAYNRGSEAGDKINLSKQVKSSDGPKKLA